jgi:hypothetical protein
MSISHNPTALGVGGQFYTNVTKTLQKLYKNFTKTLQKKTAISAEIPKFAGRWEDSRFERVQKKKKLVMDRNGNSSNSCSTVAKNLTPPLLPNVALPLPKTRYQHYYYFIKRVVIGYLVPKCFKNKTFNILLPINYFLTYYYQNFKIS